MALFAKQYYLFMSVECEMFPQAHVFGFWSLAGGNVLGCYRIFQIGIDCQELSVIASPCSVPTLHNLVHQGEGVRNSTSCAPVAMKKASPAVKLSTLDPPNLEPK